MKKKILEQESRKIGSILRDKRTSSHFWCKQPYIGSKFFTVRNKIEYMDNFNRMEGDDCQDNTFFECTLPPVEELTQLPVSTSPPIQPATPKPRSSLFRSIRSSLGKRFGSKKKKKKKKTKRKNSALNLSIISSPSNNSSSNSEFSA